MCNGNVQLKYLGKDSVHFFYTNRKPLPSRTAYCELGVIFSVLIFMSLNLSWISFITLKFSTVFWCSCPQNWFCKASMEVMILKKCLALKDIYRWSWSDHCVFRASLWFSAAHRKLSPDSHLELRTKNLNQMREKAQLWICVNVLFLAYTLDKLKLAFDR